MALSEKRTQIYLPQSLFRDLQRETRLEKKSMAQAIREAIEIYLEQRKVKRKDWSRDPLNKIVGQIKAGSDLSSHHDQHLYGK